MNIGIKGILAGVMLGISYLNNLFSPLIWALLLLIAIDIILNAHKEGEQLNKIGSAFATLGGTGLLENIHLFNLEVIHGLVAVLFLAYVNVVIPQIIKGISKLKFLATVTKAAAIAALEAENAALKAQAEKEAQKVIIAEKITP